jgi:hypothetical protein
MTRVVKSQSLGGGPVTAVVHTVGKAMSCNKTCRRPADIERTVCRLEVRPEGVTVSALRGHPFSSPDILGGGSPAAGWQALSPSQLGRMHSVRCRSVRIGKRSSRRQHWRTTMPTTLESVVTKYLHSGNPAQRTREEYATTLHKWSRWGGAVPLERIGTKEIREFVDWVHEDAAITSRDQPRPGARPRGHLASIPPSEATAGHCRAALPDQARDQCPLFRDASDAASSGLEPSLACRAVLARRFGGLLQLRGRYWNGLEDAPLP